MREHPGPARLRAVRSTTPALVAGVVSALTVAGCGSSSPDAISTPRPGTASPGGTTFRIAADPGGKPEFNLARLEASAGRVTIVLTNDSSVPHDVAIVGNGVFAKSATVENGATASVTATLHRGVYEYYSAVRGQQGAGMQGVLVVS